MRCQKHFYHWWGELILGTFRVYSTLEQAGYIPPTRFLLPVRLSIFEYMLLIDALQNVAGDAWRDRTGLNGPLMRAAFPSSPIENSDCWADMLRLSSSTFVFERAMLVDRAAAHKRCCSSFLVQYMRINEFNKARSLHIGIK